MHLSESGESRVNGYLFVLERSLKTFLPHDVVRDAVREIESHLRERIAAVDRAPARLEVASQLVQRFQNSKPMCRTELLHSVVYVPTRSRSSF